MAEIFQDNEDTWLAAPQEGDASRLDQFIDFFNELAPHYGEFDFNASTPDGNFEFVRYLGFRIEALMPEKDKRWVTDQLMAIEVPEAVETLNRAMNGVLKGALQ